MTEIQKVTYEALIAELAKHPVEIWRPETGVQIRTFEKYVRCEGVPGHWSVGLVCGKHLMPSESRDHPDLETGFGFLLAWMRERSYDPYKQSSFAYMERLGTDDCCTDSD